MNIWQFLDGIIRHPPFTIIAILVAILVGHALKVAFEFITQRRQPNSLIITLELIVVIVLGYLAVHLYVEKTVTGAESHGVLSEALLMTILLMFFSLVSMIVYIFFRAAIQGKD